jgi:predicted RNase H-like nuclease (RuvC/YqgF family)
LEGGTYRVNNIAYEHSNELTILTSDSDGIGEGATSTQQAQLVGESDVKAECTNKYQAETQEEMTGNSELSRLRGELSRARQELSDLHSLLYQRDETIRQLQQDLKSKEEALSHACKTNEESAQLRQQHTLLESKFQQQQTETAGLQAKMDRVEYLMSQVGR